jgi:ABC-type transport system involved in multi-copper enzyme maturation permease subunit
MMDMATATLTARTPAVPAAAHRPALAEALRSEFIKIRSVRSTYWTLLAQALAAIAWAGLYCAGVVSHWPNNIGFNPAEASLSGQVGLGQLIIVTLGALVITSEYSTGMIRTSLTVMPHRAVLYAAKAIVITAVSLALSLITSFVAFFTGQAILSEKHLGTTLAQPYALRAVLLSAAVVSVFGLIAYGAGAIIRNTAGTITTILGVIFLLPLLAQALPSSWFQELERWLPGGQVIGPITGGLAHSPDHLFSAWGEFAVFCGYAVVLLAVGAWSFCRRDA